MVTWALNQSITMTREFNISLKALGRNSISPSNLGKFVELSLVSAETGLRQSNKKKKIKENKKKLEERRSQSTAKSGSFEIIYQGC